MSKVHFADFIVRVGGKVDTEASCNRLLTEGFLPFLEHLGNGEDAAGSVVGPLVHAVFDSLKPGERITMEMLRPAVLIRAGLTDPKAAMELQKSLVEYMKRNTGEKETGAQFGSKIGRGGGYIRWERPSTAETESTPEGSEAPISEAAE